MDKGHMKPQQKGIRSTKEKVKTGLDQIEYMLDMIPPIVK